MSKTLIVTNDFPPRTGGIESMVFALANRLPAEELVVYTSRQVGDKAFDATLGFEVIRDPARMLLPSRRVRRRAAELVRSHQCEQVWFGASAPLGLMADDLRKAGARRLIGTTHGHEIWWSAVPGFGHALRRIGDRTDALTYLGEYCRQRIERPLSAAARSRMRQLTPGVDDQFFRPDCGGAQIRHRHGLGDRPVIVCVSRLVARKGQTMLVQSLPLIAKEIPHVALLIVGEGPDRRKIQRQIDRLGLGADVVLTGRVPYAELPAHYDAGDVFAMPARSRLGGLEAEGLGICYLEAAATGLPVIAGDSGGAPDAVLHGENGLVLVNPGVDSLAQAISSVLADRDLAAEYGRRGRAWVAEQWRWDDLAGRLHELLAGRPVSRDLS